jgi:hypothetical protein
VDEEESPVGDILSLIIALIAQINSTEKMGRYNIYYLFWMVDGTAFILQFKDESSILIKITVNILSDWNK